MMSNQEYVEEGDEDQVQVDDLVGELNSAGKSGEPWGTLDVGKLVSESRGRLPAARAPVPKASLMRGRSEYAYHLQAAEKQGQVSQ